MLPVHLARNIHKQVLYYLQSTFDFRDKDAERAFYEFLTDEDKGLFKGPWAQLRRPYRPALPEEVIAFSFPVPFLPFKHQNRSWRRLHSGQGKPQSTLVTTGTGSGKTECFLYPVLDHCLRMRQAGQAGIKAIILYPMNALAADQEKRFAKLIYDTPALRAAGVRVGNYTGRYDPAQPGAAAAGGTKAMGRDHGISNHAVQLENPPDILLTNYKMLDYLLLRPQDQPLWQHNVAGVLQYLVLDELHTYDGAQGADVACLLRRLKERLAIPKGQLCVVGTSATLDDREPLTDQTGKNLDTHESGQERLANFASKLFEEDIPVEAVIGEDRLTVEEIVRSERVAPVLPAPAACAPGHDEDALLYAMRQAALWGGPAYAGPPVAHGLVQKRAEALTEEEIETLKAVGEWTLSLGTWLKAQELFKVLLDVFAQSDGDKEGPLTWDKLVERVAREEFSFRDFSDPEDRSLLCASFFAMVAQAKELRSGMAFPLVPSQVQLWIRELRRLGRTTAPGPRFCWLDEPPKDTLCLPAFHCSECGESGWVALHTPKADNAIGNAGVTGLQLAADPSDIYQAYFGYQGNRSPNIVILCPDLDAPGVQTENAAGAAQDEFGFVQWYLCAKSLVLRQGDGPCPLTGDPMRFRVKVCRETRKTDNQQVVGDQGCPNCQSKEGVFFIGSQAATLSSVAIDELFGSVLNNDPKLLAFTDSVQDASHRAGFFTARTYNFTLRTALQHVLEARGDAGLPLSESGAVLLDWWSEARPGWRGGIREALGALMPPDLQAYQDFLDWCETGGEPSKKLRTDITRRLTWQVTSEFGIMQTHGRTLEPAGSAATGWDPVRVAETVRLLRDRLEGIDPLLTMIPEAALTLWVHGFLYRARIRGAVDHPYLEDFARQNFWGKSPFGRNLPGRETYPPGGRFKPHLLLTRNQRGHDHVLGPTRGNMAPWHVVWARRALDLPNAQEVSLLDLIAQFLACGEKTGLLRLVHTDGLKQFYTVSADAAILYPNPVNLVCDESGKGLVCPAVDAAVWRDAPSLEYYAKHGRYRDAAFSPRQHYYQDRYAKGALRRVVASEHTGLLATEEREALERAFSRTEHTDDPNLLTCTSTLEMGIDIGDLSSTMLCSIPPNTASYLQRIGRAGRATGTALIVSVVNQRPHDLFFYGRPVEMLRGKVDPPGCWLDAAAVLVRQYLAFCFDSATKTGVLVTLPGSARKLVEDMNTPGGNIPRMLEWVTKNEEELRQTFLRRFSANVKDDTIERFILETRTELISNRLHRAVGAFEQLVRELGNARTRLRKQLDELEQEEKEARQEITRELRILKGRMGTLNRTSALEILTDSGDLPNYAFPERGVKFTGAVYNQYRADDGQIKQIDLSRPAGAALTELAPANHFYTHSRCFDIQQVIIGNKENPLVETWAVCGACGHMRLKSELNNAGASPACLQCGHENAANSQTDVGQHRGFLEFSRSAALSYMEHYESLSGDSSEERNREFYQRIRSFDLTREAPVGAVGEEHLPFGIEYRASVVLREINVGFAGEEGVVPFGPGQEAPEHGFRICRDCGVVATPKEGLEKTRHRRSCTRRRANDSRLQRDLQPLPYNWEDVYLYRELASEAVRLLLPIADDEDIDTLTACIYLGLRLRFEGNPAHLLVTPQVMPDAASGMNRYYLVLMDAVPGGTGYLKTLYQEKDAQGREGEGILEVLRLAKDALENCRCRSLYREPDTDEPDGCYRCIRTFHLQYKAGTISSDRGIHLLGELIKAGEQRVPMRELAQIKPNALFGSMLEKKFVDRLRGHIEERSGSWEDTIIQGSGGFRFTVPNSERIWELQLQPKLDAAQGVMIACNPDFMLRSDDPAVKPVAIFTDGFEFHCHPNNRLADDMAKRRAILESGRYHVWSITWDDLDPQQGATGMVCDPALQERVGRFEGIKRGEGNTVPETKRMLGNSLVQLTAFIDCPHAPGWSQIAHFLIFHPLQVLAAARTVDTTPFHQNLENWGNGTGFVEMEHQPESAIVYNNKATLTPDVLTHATVDATLSSRMAQTNVLARLGDRDHEVTGTDFPERWRRFLACLNVFQFCDNFRFWTVGERLNGTAPDTSRKATGEIEGQWKDILDEVMASMKPVVRELASAGLPGDALPHVEYFQDDLGEDVFAELAWPDGHPRVAVLAGAQAELADAWRNAGWRVFTPDELQANGIGELTAVLLNTGTGE